MSRSDVEKGNGVIASHKRVIVLSAALFFASGFAALLYQVAWQRALFGWFGVDLDSRQRHCFRIYARTRDWCNDRRLARRPISVQAYPYFFTHRIDDRSVRVFQLGYSLMI